MTYESTLGRNRKSRWADRESFSSKMFPVIKMDRTGNCEEAALCVCVVGERERREFLDKRSNEDEGDPY